MKCYGRSKNDGEGYGGDVIFSEKQVLDWSDRLALKVLPEDERRIELWPDTPKDFGEIILEYSMKIKLILDLLFKAIAKLLNLEENSFLDQFGECASLIARSNFCPPCPRPIKLLTSNHILINLVTVTLHDDEIEGLQIFKDNRWFKVPTIPHALVVIIGDHMQIMRKME